MSVSFLERKNAPSLAYQVQTGQNGPTILFLTGFRSDMSGTKAAFLADTCKKSGQGIVRFDYRGHGQSGGKFEDGTIGLWLQDALDVFDNLTTGPVLLIGSSMGGWIGLLVALARKERVAGFIGLAAAPDFTKGITKKLSTEQAEELKSNGMFKLENDYSEEPYYITRALIEDGNNQCLLHAPIDLNIPVRLVQGMKDSDVEWQMAHRISNVITGDDKKVYLLEEANHRLSRPEDLKLLEKLTVELS